MEWTTEQVRNYIRARLNKLSKTGYSFERNETIVRTTCKTVREWNDIFDKDIKRAFPNFEFWIDKQNRFCAKQK